MPSIIAKFMRHVVPGVIRPLRVLWNEMIGFLFLVLAVMAVPSAVRNAREFDGDAESFFRLSLTIIFALLMAGFGISSFLRARKISRS